MGKWDKVSIFGEFDTGSNNSNSSSSDDEFNIFDRPVTWQPVEKGIPSICYCGAPVVLKTQTIGLESGRRLYSCQGNMDVRNTFLNLPWF